MRRGGWLAEKAREDSERKTLLNWRAVFTLQNYFNLLQFMKTKLGVIPFPQ